MSSVGIINIVLCWGKSVKCILEKAMSAFGVLPILMIKNDVKIPVPVNH